MTTPVTLDEDTYTEAISRIIERDFFPHLAQMKAESSYHEAQLNGDVDQLRQARQTLSQLTTNQVPVNQLQNYYHPEESDLAKRINLQLSLDQFQTVYTSEDNASFTDLLEKANAKRKSHYRWFYDKQAQQLCIEDDKTRSDTSKGGNLLMYYPEGPSKSILADVQHRGAPKSITHANTMLTTLPTTTTTTTLLQRKEEEAPWAELCGDQSTSAFRGFDLVESTPTIHPSSMEVPLMTWGSIEGTPIRIAQPGTPAGPQFSLPKESQREKLGKALSEKASRAYRKRTNERNQHVKGTPRTGSGLMSPAAQHLLRRSNTPYTKGIDMDLRSSYGGSPSKCVILLLLLSKV
ncbi:nuclear protein Es2-domain-containing protein [Chlamydoabsidia padenii]|nr:nuclear protein Es2-domain-containing protein [Chlamydoabsidia padenii]